MPRTVNLGWGSPENDLPKAKFQATAPTTHEEALDGSCDFRFEDEDAIVFHATGQGAFVAGRAMALDAYLDPEDGSLTEWTPEAILEFIQTTPIPGKRQAERKPKPKPIKAAELEGLDSVDDVMARLRAEGLLED